MNVTATGPSSFFDVTNSIGCVLFAYVPVGVYTITLPGSTCVDRGGVQPPSTSATVAGQTATTATIDCDTPGSITAQVDTKPAWSANPDRLEAHLPDGGSVRTAVAGPAGVRKRDAQTSITATPLFPFTDGYNVYSGNCTGADPTLYGQTLQPPTGGQIVGRGGSYLLNSSPLPKIREPALNITITKGGVPLAAARVRVTPTTAGCTGSAFDIGPTDAAGHPRPTRACPTAPTRCAPTTAPGIRGSPRPSP